MPPETLADLWRAQKSTAFETQSIWPLLCWRYKAGGSGAHGVLASRPLRMWKALGSVPSVSMCSKRCCGREAFFVSKSNAGAACHASAGMGRRSHPRPCFCVNDKKVLGPSAHCGLTEPQFFLAIGLSWTFMTRYLLTMHSKSAAAKWRPHAPKAETPMPNM